MDLFGTGGGGGGGGGLGSDNGPILFSEPNRTSAIDDLRSLVIYIFIITIFISFFLILPGIRNDKLPTFICIIPSLIVTSIILIALFGTTWHVGQAPISAPYKAFSKDRIQGELSVKIGLRSVNITLRAHKYYEMHASHKPVIFDDIEEKPTTTSTSTTTTTTIKPATNTNNQQRQPNRPLNSASNLAEELLDARGPDVAAAELDEDEADFADTATQPQTVSSLLSSSTPGNGKFQKRSTSRASSVSNSQNIGSNIVTKKQQKPITTNTHQHKYTIERSNVDINYNERFYWIEPNQMRQEHHNALERGLPYPILTVVEYLSQDEAGFSWSRQYRLAGYYSYVILWLSLCVCVLMFFLHCAAPKYGIYTMQCLGCLLLFTNFTYATLVPRGDQKLVIPFEGRSLSLQFGWNYWLVLIGGCLSLSVGTLIVIIDSLFPNFIFTTILDVDFDSHNQYSYRNRANRRQHRANQGIDPTTKATGALERPTKPPFYDDSTVTSKAAALAAAEVDKQQASRPSSSRGETGEKIATLRRSSFKVNRTDSEKDVSSSPPLFLGPLIKRTPLTNATFLPDEPNEVQVSKETSNSEMMVATKRKVSLTNRKQDLASVSVDMLDDSSTTLTSHRVGGRGGDGSRSNRNHHYGKDQQQAVDSGASGKNNLKITDHELQQGDARDPNDQVRL